MKKKSLGWYKQTGPQRGDMKQIRGIEGLKEWSPW
jgi:hypothetical protein